MLVAAIERNQASEGGKFVARVMPSLRSVSIAIREELSNSRRRLPNKKDIPSQGIQSLPSSLIGGPDYIVSLSESAKKYRDQPLS